MRIRKITSCITALALSLVLGLMPATSSYALGPAIATGIDVSKHQGSIDWNAVASSGVKFAFIKAGSTNSGMDPYFDYNIKSAQAVGLKTGVYLYSYANSVEEAANEASMLVGWLTNYSVSYPVVFDIENSNHKGHSPEELAAMANTFCTIVSDAGYYPMVYTSRNWFLQRIGNIGYDKWVADYSGSCQYDNNTCFWQSSSKASIPGIGGNVDFDYQFKDYSSLIIPDGFLTRGNYTFFFSAYQMKRGWVAANETRYYLDAAGHLQKGCWFTDEVGTYYLTAEDGRIARGQYDVDGYHYFFNGDGVKTTGWITLGDTKVYYNAANNGQLQTGWFTDETGTYYLRTEGGTAAKGQFDVEGGHYYFNGDGVKTTGWVTLGDKKLYYNEANNGQMQTGWFTDPTTAGIYYFDPVSGAMRTGAQAIDDAEYLFNTEGVMQTGLVTRGDPANGGGDYYYNPAGGKLMHDWITVGEGKRMYANEAGKLVSGLYEIAGLSYYFDNTHILQVNQTVQVGTDNYQIDDKGVATKIVPAAPVDPAAPAVTQ